MILVFAYKKPVEGRLKRYGAIRYIHFFLSLIFVFVTWFVFNIHSFGNNTAIELYWLIIGNVMYYIIGISLAYILKDNRAFCKYICPIPVIQKVTSRFALWKLKIDADKCTNCGACEKVCPMNIKLLSYKDEAKRVLSTECILCGTCANICPKGAIKSTIGLDAGFKEKLNYK